MSEIYDRLKKLREDENQLNRDFYKSDIWKAIYNHIKDAETCKLIEIPEASSVSCYRGTGYAINVNSILACSLLDNDNKLHGQIRTTIDVEFYGHETLEHSSERFSFDIPDTLVSDFNQEEFDGWVLRIKVERDQVFHKREIRTLRELMKKFPEIVGHKNA